MNIQRIAGGVGIEPTVIRLTAEGFAIKLSSNSASPVDSSGIVAGTGDDPVNQAYETQCYTDRPAIFLHYLPSH